jgi:hypothetical protein
MNSPHSEVGRNDSTVDGETGTTRRGWLRGLAALGAGGAALSVTSTASAQTRRERIEELSSRYGTVVDVVEAGADDTGQVSVTDVLRTHAGDDTLLVFPPGRYYMADELRLTGFTNFGLVGDDATLVPASYADWKDGQNRRLFRMGVYHDPGRDLLFEGFTVDQTAPETGIRVVEAQVATGLEVRDVLVNGKHDSGTWGPALFDVMDPQGTGLVENFRAPAGAEWVSDTPNDGNLWRGPTGIMISDYHRGTVELRDCQLGGFPDNGVYAGNAKGTVVINRGVFRNSHASSLRVGGHHSKIVGATVYVDETPAHFTNQRGIRLEKGSWLQVRDSAVILERPNGHGISVLDTVESALVDNSRVEVRGDVVNQGIVVEPLAGPTYLMDSVVDIEGAGNAVEIKGDGSPGEVGLTNVTISGGASGRVFRNAIRADRNDCQFRNVEVTQPGPEYRRALEINGDDALVLGGSFESTHHPIVVNGKRVRIDGIYGASFEGFEGVRLNDGSGDVVLRDNTLENGVLDVGCDGLKTSGNTF